MTQLPWLIPMILFLVLGIGVQAFWSLAERAEDDELRPDSELLQRLRQSHPVLAGPEPPRHAEEA